MTPLPEPQVEYWSGHREPFVFYDADQLRAYGAAEFQRGIEKAVNMCSYLGQHSMAEAIRKLGETP